ncbi:MAG: MBL fold metallo-hydrolase [Candidatus Diapherotrites archaeon]|nr:MBL fold metallo-hydrolase [Candidatus Diapherotrites archaeon]
MFREILPNLFAFESTSIGSNVFLIKGKRNALIDSSSHSNGQLLMSGLNKLGISPEKVEVVLHTHGHADHFGNSALFKHSEFWMHESDAIHVNRKDPEFSASNLVSVREFPQIKNFLRPDQKIDLGEFVLEVICTPGHTVGSVCFFDAQKKLLFSGDTLFESGVGRWDLQGGSRKQLVDSLARLSEMEFTQLFPGHGSVFSGSQRENLAIAKQYASVEL